MDFPMEWEPFAWPNNDMEALLERIHGHDNRLLLGVTGGIASGKSTVSRMLEALGAPLIDMDRIAREVVAKGTPGIAAVVARFGEEVLKEDGSLDRKLVSRIVFEDARKRRQLERITHPAIIEVCIDRINRIAANDPHAIIQLAVPLLLELKMQVMFDRILVVHIPADEQIRRLAKRDGISHTQAAAILRAQLPIDTKLEQADYVVYNHNSRAETKLQVERIWQVLNKERRKRSTP
jgi:dephospho-CoA kinase